MTPSTREFAKRIAATRSTPGTRETASVASCEIGEKPSVFWATKSPRRPRSTALAIVSRAPAAKIDAKLTRVTPIISAAAVAAVRPGWRTLFSRARRPVIPKARSIGAPTTEAIGLTSRGLSSATPMNTAAAPLKTSVRAPLASLTRKRPAASEPAPASVSSAASGASSRDGRPCVTTAPSRSAITGATRIARSAGARHDSSVTTVPTTSETTIVRVRIDGARRRQVEPDRLEQLPQAGGDEDPQPEPHERPGQPDHQPLGQHRAHHLPARGSQRAQQRELADPLHDRDRERVEDAEGADEQRDAREREQGRLQEGELVADVARLLGGLLLARPHGHRGRHRRRDAPLEGCRRDPRLRGDGDRVDQPRPAREPLGLVQGQHREGRAAEGLHPAELDEADDAVVGPGPLALDPDARRRSRSPSCAPSGNRWRPRAGCPAIRPRRA